MTDKDGSREYRALFISDVHLGTRGCQAERLLDFLREYDAETIFLVGDIVDGWALRGGWYWPQPHNDVVQKLLRKARKGARCSSCSTSRPTTGSASTATSRSRADNVARAGKRLPAPSFVLHRE